MKESDTLSSRRGSVVEDYEEAPVPVTPEDDVDLVVVDEREGRRT